MEIKTNKRGLNISNLINYKIISLDIYDGHIYCVEYKPRGPKLKDATKLALAAKKGEFMQFTEELVNCNFKDEYVRTEEYFESYDINLILENRFMVFESENFRVTFHNGGIELFDDLIAKLRQRRTEDQYLYAQKNINSGIVNNLNIRLIPDISENYRNACTLVKDGYSNSLNYELSNRYTGNFRDIKNLVVVMDNFDSIRGKAVSITDGAITTSLTYRNCDTMNIRGSKSSNIVQEQIKKMIRKI